LGFLFFLKHLPDEKGENGKAGVRIRAQNDEILKGAPDGQCALPGVCFARHYGGRSHLNCNEIQPCSGYPGILEMTSIEISWYLAGLKLNFLRKCASFYFI
jgi:hypothetical protein